MINIFKYKRPTLNRVQFITPKYLEFQDFVMVNRVEIGYNIISYNYNPDLNNIFLNAHCRIEPIKFNAGIWVISPIELDIDLPVVDPYQESEDE